MSKSHSPLVDYLIYVGVRLLVCLVQCLSFSAAQKLADGLAWLAYRVDRRHRDVARDNLRQALGPDPSAADIEEMVRNVYRHFCTVLVEMILLPRKLQPANWRSYLELVEGERILDRLLSDRPLLIVTGHFGNWEMAGYALGMLGFKTYAIARPLDNPYLDDFLKRFRQKTGQQLLAKHGDFEQLETILASGGVVATLADQDAGQRGLFVDFFGRPASTHKAVALLALEHRVPLAVVGAPRVAEPCRYQIITQDVILPEEYDGHPDPVRAITQRFTSALEQLIRRAPKQYFWLHRRWKHQPAKSKRQQAA